MRDSFLLFARPDLGATELDMVREVLESGWITTGAMAHRLEEEFAGRVGAAHAVAVNSCTAALHLALEAINLKRGDEVITTPYTFASTAEVVRYFGAQPRFVDILPDTLNIDPEAVRAAVNGHTRAIIPVHFAGHPAEMEAIDEIASSHGLAVIEDAAHSLPASYRNQLIGSRRPSLGQVQHLVCYSFYATKTMTTGEGGMICTDDRALAERCRVMSLHGISRDAWNRYAADGSWYYEIVAPGYKYNLTDIAAAIGLAQLSRLDVMNQRRNEIAAAYNRAFSAIECLETPTTHPWVETSWQLYPLRLNLQRLSIDRARFFAELKSRNIGTSVHFIPLHTHPYYRDTCGYEPTEFPVAHREYQREISLPIYSLMTDNDIQDVVEAVIDVARIFSC